MKKIISIIFILFIFSFISYADFETGNDILSKYTPHPSSGGEAYDNAYSHGYIIGVFDAFDGLFFSSPQRVTAGQVIEVAIKYLKEHPESRHEPATKLLKKAFAEAFPIEKEIDKKGRSN